MSEKIPLERKKEVARESRGVFKLKRHLEDVDLEIGKQSVKATARDLREISRG